MAKIGSFLYIAERDSKLANSAYDIKEYTGCGQLCEKCVEKSLKAYISEFGSETDLLALSAHNPHRLYEKCCELGFEKFDKDMAFEMAKLADYYRETRYPGDNYFELTETEARDALKIMRYINNKVKESLNNMKKTDIL